MAEEQQRRRHRKDPSEGGWDTTIIKAPDSHKSRSHRHRRHRHLSTGQKVLRVIGIVLAVIVGLAVAVGLGLLIALLVTGTIRL